MEDDHRSSCGEVGYQGHELFGLDGAGIRGCKDFRGSASATRRCGINPEGFGCQGWLDPGRTSPNFSCERHCSAWKEAKRQYTTRRLAQIEAASTAALVTMPTTTWGTVLKEGARLTKQSEQNLNTLLNGSTELDDVARALNMLDVESQEGIIKTPVKLVVHSFMENGTSTESQLREEETNETNDQSEEEEEELCPPLEETMAASWIAQIGEEDLSETEAVDSFIAMNEQRKRTWAHAQVLKKAARKDRGFFSSRAGVRNRGNASRQMRQSLRRSPNPTDGDGTPKDLRARLRKENRCFRCKKKGHWKNECPEKQHNRDGTAPPVFSGLTFLHTFGEESVWNAATWSDQCDEDAAWAIGFPGIPSGHLIVDSAAGQALIGEAACVEWERKLSTVGLHGVRVNGKVMTPRGSGRHGTSHKIDDDAHHDRWTLWGVALHCGEGGYSRTVAIEFSGETGSDDQSAHEQAPPSTSQSSCSYASHTRRTPYDRCDDGTDASHISCARRSFATIWVVLASVRDGRRS